MNKKTLLFNRFALVIMDVKLFADLAIQLKELKEDQKKGIRPGKKKEVLECCSRINLDKEFGSILFDVSEDVPPDQKFLTTLSQYRVARNRFVSQNIVPLKKAGDLKIKDSGWETERIKRIKVICEGSGIANGLIGNILVWLHEESRKKISEELGR